MVKSISILGCTGSIGRQTIAVAEHIGMPVAALTANRKIDMLEEQARRLHPKFVAVYDETAAKQFKIEQDKAAARDIAARLEAVQVKIKATAGADGRLYGSITTADVADALKEQAGIELDKRKIVSEAPIKAFGSYTLEVKLYPEIVGKINLIVCQ